MKRFNITNKITGSKFSSTGEDLNSSFNNRFPSPAHGQPERRFPISEYFPDAELSVENNEINVTFPSIPERSVVDEDTGEERTIESVPEKTVSLREVKPDWYITTYDDKELVPTLDKDDIVLPQQYEVEEIDITSDERRAAVKDAHELAWRFIYKYYDEGGLLQLAVWKLSLDTEHPAQELLNAVEEWKNAIMHEYLFVKKPAILAGEEVSFDYSFIGAAPHSFTDIILTVNGQ